MRVISKQHDYYDTVNFGGDVMYVRHEQKPVIRETPSDIERIFELLPSQYAQRGLTGGVRGSLICFCGKIYPLVTLTRYSNRWEPHWINAYSTMDLDRAFWKYSKTLKELNGEYDKPKKRSMSGLYHTRWRHFRPFRKFLLKELFLEFGKKVNDQIFFDLGSPVFIINQKENLGAEWIVNPHLAEVGFQRIFGPYAAHQEIEMYLGGVLGNKEIDTVGVSDKYLKSQKGFDKWSFKKMPTKKR